MDSRFNLSNNKRAKSRLNLRKKRHKKVMQKRIILASSTILLVGGFVIGTYYIGSEEQSMGTQIETNADDSNNTQSQKDENSSEQKESLDNNPNKENGQTSSNNIVYLPLEDDQNAEDALEVFHTTEGLLKGTLQYPVRTDGKKVVYLTFDDGPSTENTGNVLDTLNKYGIKGTFFVTGQSIDKSDEAKELLKRIANEGHAIANHTYSHDYNKLYPGKTIDAEAFIKDIDKCNQSMKDVLGEDFSTRVIRFPGGYWSWNGRSNIRPIIDERGYAIMDWNTLNEDAQGSKKDAAKLIETTKANVEKLGPNADSIVFLMHDTYGKSETAKSLPEVIEYFKSLGFEFKTIK